MTYAQISELIDTNLESGTEIPAELHREVEHALLDYIQANLSQTGDIKRIKCDLTYYNANFETDGLGKNLRLGWAQCNGNNGTDNLTGRVGIGFGTGYNKFSGLGGSADAVVVEHSHTVNQIKGYGPDQGADGFFDRSLGELPFGITTDSTGVSGVGKNMQPYIIQLYIMKL